IAALVAPGLSMAIAATGTPAGICTLESSASMPDSTVVAIGTAITGRVVSAATTPARCAAPPAATTTTFSPLSIAVVAYSCVRAGERCADTTSISNGIENLSSIFADLLMVLLRYSEWPWRPHEPQSHLRAKFARPLSRGTTLLCDLSMLLAAPHESRPSDGMARMGSSPRALRRQSQGAAPVLGLRHSGPPS